MSVDNRVVRAPAAGQTLSPPLSGRVVVLSPHLDDAVFSLGAAISASTEAGTAVSIVTVFAGSPSSREPAGDWDRDAGFRDAGEAAHRRAEEDERACAIVGASPQHLPFGDRQYVRNDAALEGAIRAAVLDAETILAPGFPLAHPDHLLLHRLVLQADFGNTRIGIYTEQPYAALARLDPPENRLWRRLAVDDASRRAKLEAALAYTSQVPLLGGRRTVFAILAYDANHGGETIAWLDERPGAEHS